MDPTAAPPQSGVPVVLVTGASSGVGLAVATELARRGRGLALLARGEGPLQRAAEQCRALGAPSVTALPLDVRDDGAVARAVKRSSAPKGASTGSSTVQGSWPTAASRSWPRRSSTQWSRRT